MKKIITFALLLAAFTQVNAQTYLIDGIYSGMTSDNYTSYCDQHYETSEHGAYICKFLGNSYFINPLKNADQLIYTVVFTSFYIYSPSNKDAMLNTANEIKNYFISQNYDQKIDNWPDINDIKVDSASIAYSLEKGTMQVFIGVYRYDTDDFRLNFSIIDDTYNTKP